MAQKGGGKNVTIVKPIKSSSMAIKENEDINFQMSNLVQQVKGSMKIVDLANLQGEFRRRMENMEKSMEKLVSLVRNSKENLPKGDDVNQGTYENKECSC